MDMDDLLSAAYAAAGDEGDLKDSVTKRFSTVLLAFLVLSIGAAPAFGRSPRSEANLAYGPAPAQRLDVYFPERPAPRPAVFFMVHGGAWRFGDKASPAVTGHKLAHWAAQGDLFVSANYRMLPQADPLEQAHDVAAAIRFAQAHAAAWGADPRDFVLLGHSAGAHLVALVESSPELRQGLRPWRATILLDSAAYDVPSLMRARHPRLYDRAFGSDERYWESVSPYEALARSGRAIEPVLAVCSTRRHTSCRGAQRFAAEAIQLGGRAEVLGEDLSHAEINRELGEPGAYTDKVDEFLRRLSGARAARR